MTTLDDQINAIPIAEATPSDRPHLLAWDTCHERHLKTLEWRHGTHRINYPQNLLTRHTEQSTSPHLLLHKRIDREINAIRDLVATSPKSYIQLEGLDRLITYLAITDSRNLDLFWQKLIDLRQLSHRLWIILPSSLIPNDWPRDRLHTITALP